MFDLVARVEDYPAFLPWCAGTAVDPCVDGVRARVDIAYRGIRQSFTTRNLHRPPGEIAMQLVDGPFRSLSGRWLFHPLASDACKVELRLDYEMRAGLLGTALAPVFGQIAGSLVEAFEQRAEDIYE